MAEVVLGSGGDGGSHVGGSSPAVERGARRQKALAQVHAVDGDGARGQRCAHQLLVMQYQVAVVAVRSGVPEQQRTVGTAAVAVYRADFVPLCRSFKTYEDERTEKAAGKLVAHVRKRLQQMRRLEALVATGGALDPQQRSKLSQRDAYLRANAALERGEPAECAAAPSQCCCVFTYIIPVLYSVFRCTIAT